MSRAASRRALLPLLFLLIAVAGCGEATDPSYIAEIDAWHADRVARLTTETGWLTLIGLHEVREGTHTLGAAADNAIVLAAGPDRVGEITLVDGAVTFTPDPAADIWRFVDGVEGARFDAGPLATDADGVADQLAVGPVVFYPIVRGDKVFLRVKDRQAALRRDFPGIDRFAVDARWRVEARLEGEPATIEVTNVLGQTSTEETAGVLVGSVAGHDFRMLPLALSDGRLFLIFGDRTNGSRTYPGGRFLALDAPDAEGRVVIDFNRAYNPPCAFTDFSTCELPVPENTLPVVITAGEKKFGAGH